MKRLLIILFCLPLLFACQKDELFEEGQEIVLKFSVDVGNLESATRAFAEDADRSSDLWLVLFDKSGYLVNQPIPATIGTTTGDETEFSVTLPATVEERIVHFLLNPPLSENKFELEYGHENNLIGGLIAGPNHDVYWQRVELPNILNENVLGEAPIPLLRNFAKITVTENVADFEIAEVYVLNKPDRGTVAPFLNGSFFEYTKEDGNKKTYEELNTAGYWGFMPEEYGLINPSANVDNLTSKANKETNGSFYSFYDYLYESTNSKNNVSVLIKSTATTNNWYRVDLVKANNVGVLEYYDVLRNFDYQINITGVDVGHSTVRDAILQPAGNNILNSVTLSNLTSITDDETNATLEVSYTDTVLTKTGEVKVKYRFTVGSQNKNGNIAGKSDKDGWYYTWEGQEEEGKSCPISEEISFGSFEDANGWREVTINVKECAGRNVELTFYAVEGENNRVLSRTVTFYLLGEQKLEVECTPLVPLGVGQAVDVSLLIPKGLPETMFPLDFAIESQAAADETLSYLAQYITPANRETVSVKTGGSIVEGFEGKKSFQYVVTLTYDQYDDDDVSEKVVDGITMKVFTTKFKTNTAVSASTVYAYNSYFNLGKDNFKNPNLIMSGGYKYYGNGKSFSVSGDDANNITVKENGEVLTKTNNSFTTKTFASPIEVVYADSEGDISLSYEREILVCNKFAINNNNSTGLNDNTNITIEYATASKQGSVSATKKQLTDGGLELVIPGLTAPDETISIVLSYTYTYTTGNYWNQQTITEVYNSNTINTKVGNLMNAQISGITFTKQ